MRAAVPQARQEQEQASRTRAAVPQARQEQEQASRTRAAVSQAPKNEGRNVTSVPRTKAGVTKWQRAAQNPFAHMLDMPMENRETTPAATTPGCRITPSRK
eukprot:686593-Pelagomonas_calceolata.AAC.3